MRFNFWRRSYALILSSFWILSSVCFIVALRGMCFPAGSRRRLALSALQAAAAGPHQAQLVDAAGRSHPAPEALPAGNSALSLKKYFNIFCLFGITEMVFSWFECFLIGKYLDVIIWCATGLRPGSHTFLTVHSCWWSLQEIRHKLNYMLLRLLMTFQVEF